MPRYTTTRTKRRYAPYARGSRNKTTSLPVATAEVKKIAKKVFRNSTDLKQLMITRSDLAVLYTSWFYTDPMQFIVAGTGSGQRIGSRLQDVYLKLSFNYVHYSTTHEGSKLRILVIRAEQQLPNAASTWVESIATSGGDFPQLLSNDYHQSSGVVSRHDYTVLRDVSLPVSELSYSANTYGIPVSKRINVRLGNMTYMDDDVGGVNYQKMRNVYILVGASNTGTTRSTTAGYLQFSGYIFWRDA